MLEEAKLLDEDYDNRQGRRSWGTSINVGGTTYATSLFWQPLQNTSDPFQEVEDASAGILEGADLFCIKDGKAPQFGICVSHEGFRNGEMVGAASLATALSNISSYIAVFKVREGWWYICTRNDIILSDGDMLFLSEEEAKNQFSSMLAVPDWGKKIAPKEWGIEDTEEMELDDVLVRGAKSRLQKIKGLRGAKLFLIIGISAVVGLWLISSLIDRLFLTPSVAPVIVPIKPKVLQTAAPVQETLPWDKVLDAKVLLNECYKSTIDLVKIMPPGWNIGEIICANKNIATSWTRDVGLLSWAEQAVEDSGLPFSAVSFSGNGSMLTATLPIQAGEELSSPPDMNLIDLQNTLNNQFQSIGVPISLVIENEKATTGKFYKKIKFSFTSEHNPLIWAKLLTKYSGLYINIIRYSPAGNIWHYEGAIYVL